MINNVEMLNYIRQNVEMGIHGITHILDRVSDDKLKTALEDQRREYGKIYGAADKAIRQLGHQPVHVDKMAKIGSDMSTVFKTMADGSGFKDCGNDDTGKHYGRHQNYAKAGLL